MDDFVERMEAPTPRRRDEARLEGRVARSADLTAAATLGGAIVLLVPLSMHIVGQSRVLVEAMLGGSATDPAALLAAGCRAALSMLAPLAVTIWLLGVAVGAVQTRFLFTLGPLTPRLSRLSPVEGWKRIFCFAGAVRLGMSLAKVAAAVAIIALVLRADLAKLAALTQLEGPVLLGAAAWLVWTAAAKVTAALLALAVLDYVVQRARHERELHMSRPQMREELRRTEGDPLVRQRRGSLARQLAARRAHGGVREADVLIVDPKGFAVALRYDARLESPQVTARAAGAAAGRLRSAAVEHDVPIIERSTLARSLAQRVDVGQPVPQRLYDQVAEVLAHVYRLAGRRLA
jgi:flagellar biosynthesis protein FlhB